MTKDELKEYRWLQRNIKQMEERLFELESEAQRVTTRLSHTPGKTGNKDILANQVVKIVELQDEINTQLAKARDMEKEILRATSKLPEKEKYVVRARYIKGKRWEQICVDINYEWAQVHRYHARALELLKHDMQ